MTENKQVLGTYIIPEEEKFRNFNRKIEALSDAVRHLDVNFMSIRGKRMKITDADQFPDTLPPNSTDPLTLEEFERFENQLRLLTVGTEKMRSDFEREFYPRNQNNDKTPSQSGWVSRVSGRIQQALSI